MSIYRKDSLLPKDILDELSKKKRRLDFVL